MTKDKVKHIETDFYRATIIEDPELVKKQDTKGGIKVPYEYKGKVHEIMFFPGMTIFDSAGDPILYYKISHKERLVLYLMTGHPDSQSAAITLSDGLAIFFGITGKKYQIKNVMDYFLKMLEDMESGKFTLDGKPAEFKSGPHPKIHE